MSHRHVAAPTQIARGLPGPAAGSEPTVPLVDGDNSR
jgi:hypothetical protein